LKRLENRIEERETLDADEGDRLHVGGGSGKGDRAARVESPAAVPRKRRREQRRAGGWWRGSSLMLGE
jgi:hypothetical protein